MRDLNTDKQKIIQASDESRSSAHKLRSIFQKVSGALGIEGFMQKDVQGNIARVGRVKCANAQMTTATKRTGTIPASSETTTKLPTVAETKKRLLVESSLSSISDQTND